MAYATQTDLEKKIEPARLVQLTDDNNDGVADTAPIAEAIAAAGSIIDSYLATRYTVPVSPVPDLVRTMAADLAIYLLFSRRDQTNDARTAAYKDALTLLGRIASGTATIGAPESSVPDQGGPVANRTEADRVFTIGRASSDTPGTLDRF
jgi:phage gp36-like protein